MYIKIIVISKETMVKDLVLLRCCLQPGSSELSPADRLERGGCLVNEQISQTDGRRLSSHLWHASAVRMEMCAFPAAEAESGINEVE